MLLPSGLFVKLEKSHLLKLNNLVQVRVRSF